VARRHEQAPPREPAAVAEIRVIAGRAEFRVEDDALRIVTDAPITGWRKLFDEAAKFSGHLPTWQEMQYRSRPARPLRKPYKLVFEQDTGPEQDRRLWNEMDTRAPGRVRVVLSDGVVVAGKTTMGLTAYTVVRQDGGKYVMQGPAPAGEMPWSKLVGRSHPAERPIRYAPGKKGVLRVNSVAASCSAYMWSAIRIFDEKGACVWEDRGRLTSTAYPVAVDLSGDGVDEIVLWSNNGHGKSKIIVYEIAPPPAVRPGSPQATQPAAGG
ncbi:hypothetical protein LCGC14_3006240, partial [marine sediment metagenome]